VTAPTYAWLITHDSIADDSYPLGSYCNARGVAGPHGASQDLLSTLHRAANIGKVKWHTYNEDTTVQWFKMYDSDRNLYYSGVRTGEADELGGSEELFEPLDEFGTPNAGATEIRYYNPDTKEWDSL
jgi:hypothetical protein